VYGLKELAAGSELTVNASSKEELFVDAVRGTLAALYGEALREPAPAGGVFPVQAAGLGTAGQLKALLEACVGAARSCPAGLLAPRWMAFDEDRVTATLGISSGGSRPADLAVGEVSPLLGAPQVTGFRVLLHRA
jgi:hypothetical protein